MLTGRKCVGQCVDLSVCIERRIVKIVGRVASSQGCGVYALGRKSGKRLGVCLPQKGRCLGPVSDTVL